MSKEEYLLEKTTISENIEKLRKDLKSLEIKYIEESAPFKIDDLVMVSQNDNESEKGIVDGFEVDYTGDIKPIVKKIKKDGTKSQHKIWVWHSSKISKID
jgi:hypothetical protein